MRWKESVKRMLLSYSRTHTHKNVRAVCCALCVRASECEYGNSLNCCALSELRYMRTDTAINHRHRDWIISICKTVRCAMTHITQSRTLRWKTKNHYFAAKENQCARCFFSAQPFSFAIIKYYYYCCSPLPLCCTLWHNVQCGRMIIRKTINNTTARTQNENVN